MKRLAFAIALLFTGIARANEPVGDIDNECEAPGGQGLPCVNATQCALNPFATICVETQLGVPSSRRCQIPCETLDGSNLVGDPLQCSLGETCVEGRAMPGRMAHYCAPSRFRMDLNLLDQCLVHFLEGTQPSLGAENTCSLERNLSQLLDQNADGVFDIFDMDLCVLAFLDQPTCDPDELTSSDRGTAPGAPGCEADDLTFCEEDNDCGRGLYCDQDRAVCQRDCGVIASRETSLDVLERQCSGALKSCNFERGRCEEVDLEGSTCQVEADCPQGSYCFLGSCAPNCYSSLDCPGSRWYCTLNNQCRALPPPAATGFVFEPKNYAIRFGRPQLDLDAVQIRDSSPIVILDLLTKREVRNNPSVSFGYRLEIKYDLKQDTKCFQPFVECSDAAQRPEVSPGVIETEAECNARQNDCIIDDTEEWIRPVSPFGTINAQGSPRMAIDLEEPVTERLSPGLYSANITAIFDNGDSHSIRVFYTKVTPSGEYTGNLTVYMHGPENALNPNRPIKLAMKVKVTDEYTRWNEIVDTSAAGNGFEDTTPGYLVHAVMHGNNSFAYAAGDAFTTADNEIPFVGLYSPDLGRLRLIGLIDLAADFCIDETGADCADLADNDDPGDNVLRVKNLFGRPIRRVVEFFGPFDDATRRFHGIYREKISGLASTLGGDLTLEGGFILDQQTPDDSPVPADHQLDIPLTPTSRSFPSTSTIITDRQAKADTLCTLNQRGKFANSTAYSAYRSTAGLAGDQRDNRILNDLVTFEDAIDEALGALGTDAGADQAHLNIYDFLSSRILPCDPDDPSPPPVCIDADEAYCGLALYQKALLSGWTNISVSGGGSASCAEDDDCPADQVCDSGTCRRTSVGDQELFCLDTISVEGCETSGADASASCSNCDPELFTLQEHNRFWLNLAQILLFDGDKARSDAFFTLFRNAENPFAEGAALSYKEERLVHAMQRYDALTRLMSDPAATAVLWAWPMRDFKQVGNEWLNIMQQVLERRMSAVAEIVDLKRRVFLNASGSTRMLAQHLVQNEYLLQVYVMALQERWQDELFAYRGEAGKAFDVAQSIVLQLDPSRNPIGVLANQTFFENSDTSRSNWQNYQKILVGQDGNGGLIADAKEEIDAAVVNLKNSLSDLDGFEEKLFDARVNLENTLDRICGNPAPQQPSTGTGGYCAYLKANYRDHETWKTVASCVFEETPDDQSVCGSLDYLCSDYDHVNDFSNVDECDSVITTFTDATSGYEPACDLDTAKYWVNVHGDQRPCVGGEMGALIQEKAHLDSDRKDVLGDLITLADEMKYTLKHYEDINDNNESNFQKVRAVKLTQFLVRAIMAIVEGMYETTTKIMEAPDCLFVAGLAVGTDCAGHIASVVSDSVFTGINKGMIKPALEKAVDGLDFVSEQLEHDNSNKNDDLGFSKDMRMTALKARDLTSRYQALTQRSFNIHVKLDDLRYQAQSAADQYTDRVTFVAEHLVGRETGSLLVGNHLVQRSADTFRKVLQYTYRLTQAFSYYFNLSPAETTQLANEILAAVTVDDVEQFIERLEERAEQYCGSEAIDCDSLNNIETLRFSVREQLFPNLRDIVDARTGNVVTAGEQFHNLITQPPYLQRRIRGTDPADQIELTVSLPLTAKENTPVGPRWLIDPLTCNHQLVAAPGSGPLVGGNIAANFVGHNLGTGAHTIRYELIRGNTDFQRSCRAESIQEEIGTLPVLQYPIRSRLVGYAPQAEQAVEDVPPSYVTRSSSFPGCINAVETIGDIPNAPCWRYFARDRSLSAPDWKVVIPVRVGGAATDSTWVLGEGLPDEQRPIIDDIVLYFRYRTRPIAEF